MIPIERSVAQPASGGEVEELMFTLMKTRTPIVLITDTPLPTGSKLVLERITNSTHKEDGSALYIATTDDKRTVNVIVPVDKSQPATVVTTDD